MKDLNFQMCAKEFCSDGQDGQVYIAVDTETTGLGNKADTNYIVQLNMLAFRIVDGECVVLGQKNWYVKPDIPIPPAATAIHGITDKMVCDCPSISTVLADFKAECNKYPDSVYVCHNAPYDVGIINAHNEVNFGVPFFSKTPPARIQDTLAISRRVFVAEDVKKLENLVKLTQLPSPPGGEQFHNAETDVWYTAQLLTFYLKNNIVKLEKDSKEAIINPMWFVLNHSPEKIQGKGYDVHNYGKSGTIIPDLMLVSPSNFLTEQEIVDKYCQLNFQYSAATKAIEDFKNFVFETTQKKMTIDYRGIFSSVPAPKNPKYSIKKGSQKEGSHPHWSWVFSIIQSADYKKLLEQKVRDLTAPIKNATIIYELGRLCDLYSASNDYKLDSKQIKEQFPGLTSLTEKVRNLNLEKRALDTGLTIYKELVINTIFPKLPNDNNNNFKDIDALTRLLNGAITPGDISVRLKIAPIKPKLNATTKPAQPLASTMFPQALPKQNFIPPHEHFIPPHEPMNHLH